MPTYTPVISSVFLTPSPSLAGETVFISVSAVDVESIPGPMTIQAGEFMSGEW